MRGLRIGFGLSLGLVGLFGISQCSFSLPERTVCTDLGCKAGTDDQGPPPPDLAKDPNDPSMNGTFQSVLLPMTPPAGLADQVFMGPSDDGSTLSSRQATYPLVLMAPSQSVPLQPMRIYADRLVSHGFIVGMFYVSNQTKDGSYRDTGLAYLNAILSSPMNANLDTTKIGVLGYQLSAKIAAAMVVNKQTPPLIDALFMINPADLFSNDHIDGTSTMMQLHLPNNNTLVMLGDPHATTGAPPCIQPPQKGYGDFFTAAPSPTLAIVFGNANLGDFIQNFPDPTCNSASSQAQAQTQSLAVKYATAYFQWTLKGSNRARDYLLGPDFNTDAQSAMLTSQSK